MKLLNKQIIKRFRELSAANQNSKDPIVVAKFFNPFGAGTWLATEYDEKNGIFFGYVSIFGDHNDEWGDFSLSELENYRSKIGTGIERDINFNECPISEVMPKAIIKR